MKTSVLEKNESNNDAKRSRSTIKALNRSRRNNGHGKVRKHGRQESTRY